jgi:hypothetical protein
MGFCTVVGDQANGTGRCQVSDECIAWGDKVVINTPKTDSASNQSALFHASSVPGSVLQRRLLDFNSG